VFIARIAQARRGFTPAATTDLAPPQRKSIFPPRILGGAAIVALALAVVARQARGFDWGVVWSRLATADGRILAAATVVFWLTAVARTLRWRRLLAGAGGGSPALPTLLDIYVRGWFANCVSVAQLGDVYRADLLRRTAGVPRATTLGAIVAERLIDLAVLAAMLAGAATEAFAGDLPPGIWTGSAATLVLAIAGGFAFAALGRRRVAIERIMPVRFRAASAALLTGFRGSLRALPAAAALSAGAWLLEGATLALVARALGIPIGPAGALAAALIGALLTAVPVLPAGLGLTEAGLVVVLLRLGVAADGAAAIALLSRAITYWSVVAVGGALTLSRHRARGVDHVV
jgi:glycosyltransferase 2 family protein